MTQAEIIEAIEAVAGWRITHAYMQALLARGPGDAVLTAESSQFGYWHVQFGVAGPEILTREPKDLTAWLTRATEGGECPPPAP